MNPYPSYKPSGIDWFGNIPLKWNYSRLKYSLKGIISGGTPNTSNNEYWDDDNGIPWVSIADITSSEGHLNTTQKRITQKAVSETNLEIIPKGTLCISIFASLGKTTILDIDATVNQAILGLVTNETILRGGFLKYYLVFTESFISFYSSSNTQENLNLTKIKNLPIYLPSIVEQTAIANYLDEKTAQIDTLIVNKQKLIELLKEERMGVINEVFNTKGKKLQNRKLKHIAEIVLGKMLTSDDKGGFSLKPYLRAANMKWLNVDITDVKEMWFSPYELEKLRIKENNLLVSEGGEVGRTCIWKNELPECYIQNSVHKITFHKGYNPYFFLYQFYLLGNIGYFDSIVNKISIGHLTVEKIREVSVMVASLEEQTAIVYNIESQFQRIDDLISKIEKEIELMQEYRTALISEVVTGKIKVA